MEAQGQQGGGTTGGSIDTSNLCDACGASATYSETVATSGGYSKRTITSSGCPNHYSYCTGKVECDHCGGSTANGIITEGSISEASDQGKSLEIPAEPVIAASVNDNECQTGDIGIALNGVSIYNGVIDFECNMLDVDDDTSEWTSFDYCSGHGERNGD